MYWAIGQIGIITGLESQIANNKIVNWKKLYRKALKTWYNLPTTTRHLSKGYLGLLLWSVDVTSIYI